jgi:hypothetical protein
VWSVVALPQRLHRAIVPPEEGGAHPSKGGPRPTQ